MVIQTDLAKSKLSLLVREQGTMAWLPCVSRHSLNRPILSGSESGWGFLDSKRDFSMQKVLGPEWLLFEFLFRCIFASLQEALSVGWLVGPSVGQSVTLSPAPSPPPPPPRSPPVQLFSLYRYCYGRRSQFREIP